MVDVDLEKVVNSIKGNKNSFAELIEERKKDIFRIAYIYIKNSTDAMDVLHDTVYRAYISIRKLKNPEFFNTWIIKITINCCLGFLKSKKKINDNEIQYVQPDKIYQYTEKNIDISEVIISSIDLLDAVEKLEFNLKTIIILKYYQDLTIKQIAQILSCPVGTVKTRLSKALNILKEELKDLYGGGIHE